MLYARPPGRGMGFRSVHGPPVKHHASRALTHRLPCEVYLGPQIALPPHRLCSLVGASLSPLDSFGGSHSHTESQGVTARQGRRAQLALEGSASCALPFPLLGGLRTSEEDKSAEFNNLSSLRNLPGFRTRLRGTMYDRGP